MSAWLAVNDSDCLTLFNPGDIAMRTYAVSAALCYCFSMPGPLVASELEHAATVVLQSVADERIKLAKGYAAVIDEQTAHAAAPRIAEQYERLLTAFADAVAFKKKHGGVLEENEGERLKAVLRRAEDSFYDELERLDHIKGLPVEFWNVARVGNARDELAMLGGSGKDDDPERLADIEAYGGMVKLFEKFGPDRVVELYISDCAVDARVSIMMHLSDLLGSEAQIVDFSDSENDRVMSVVVGPVNNFEGLLAKIAFGEVTSHERARGIIRVKRTPPPDRTSRTFRDFDEKSPEYHAQLADLLTDERAFNHREAVQKLLNLKPADVPDKKLRVEIARGFRRLAFDSRFEQREGVQGLVIWGGKHSVPLLIELLGKATEFGGDESIFDGLAKYPTAEGAKAVAGRLSNHFDREKAGRCLLGMGSVAEDAVLAVVPANELRVNLMAIGLLGEIGTKKCAATLRRAGKSRDPQIRMAATAASKAIRLRERQKAVVP